MGVECLSRRQAPDPSGYGDTLYKLTRSFSCDLKIFRSWLRPPLRPYRSPNGARQATTVLCGVQGLGYHTVCVCVCAGGGGYSIIQLRS